MVAFSKRRAQLLLLSNYYNNYYYYYLYIITEITVIILDVLQVDMEAFLELNSKDLKGLGVIDRDARNLLLAVIEKLNNGKVTQQHK